MWLSLRSEKQTSDRFTVVSPTYLPNVQLATKLSCLTNVLGQFPHFFRLISGLKNELKTSVSHFFVSRLKERGKFVFVSSDRFVSSAKRFVGEKDVGEKTRRRND